ncbi:MAG: type II toxin-antitoxin system RatA family toxin [Rickettsia endosymbiont of Ixodes persulcatus]|nr:type II toxin-antitoxin system RatA family toxin [Rickettsia endosymbiont of Ixodes persulcatus]MCZ6903400.1 type II toxin-antitoxin system RatA family toxin [Rickettsia endosymbiont of Ixodes persulcatus]MCZ6909265.1 type II toxin-antitoxin system RatA family toxin [Rickettsia endosymbiont of Ixodes persulcatus]MCZ6909691.1 type II toxin-antitoxin system RatA family toxin [Rickettsia endosymbiont of Ixodes persulcatus]MCZ6913151.1 type II toxin-antitoxin system RatA family toxin [Rickettsia
MPSFEQIKVLPYKPQELFDLVWDVKSYPKFLPWCVASRIISEDNYEIIAELVIQLKGFSEKYNSRVTNAITDDGIYLIDTVAISGPFKYLKSTWQFVPRTAGTELKFFIDFKMKSVILDKLIGTYFTKATEKMIVAFEKRAKDAIR